MRNGISDAITGWNDGLGPYGDAVPEYIPSDTPCAGPMCINMRKDSNQVPPNACAGGSPTYDPSTGFVTGSNIYFPNSSDAWTRGFAARTAGHEIGHHLGLDDNHNFCPFGPSGSVMKSPMACNAPTSQYPTSPTTSDTKPVGDGAYSDDPTKMRTCPPNPSNP
jgi:hypothetical protein